MMTQTLKGFRDFLPKEIKLRNIIINTLKETFQSFGFEELQTPALEYSATLLGKYGPEADSLVYTFADRGGREVGLRYDLTVPLSRVIASHPNIPIPFKRYQIQPVWRAENTQRGRYREFYQCDIDTVGVKSILADAEIISCAFEAFRRLGFSDFLIQINDRQILLDIMSKSDVPEDLTFPAIRAIDKFEKIGDTGVRKELSTLGLATKITNNILNLSNRALPNQPVKNIFNYLNDIGIPKNNLVFNPRLSRGLDYYTGPIYEVTITKPLIGSLAGGGRYDNLIYKLGGPDTPATGISLGLERIIEAVKELQIYQETYGNDLLLITYLSDEFIPHSLKLASEFRKSGIPTEVYLEPGTSIQKQMRYADKKGVWFTIIVGRKEIELNAVTLRNLKNGEQFTLDYDSAIKKIQETHR